MGISCMPTENKFTQTNLSEKFDRHLEEGDLSAVLPLFPVFFPFIVIPVLIFFIPVEASAV